MYSGAIIGKEIIGICVAHDEINPKNNILDRPIRIRLNHKSHRRTGKLPVAYVNKEIIKGDNLNPIYISNPMLELNKKLKEKYGIEFDVKDKGEIKSKQIFGECSSKGKVTILPKHSSVHRGQRVPMTCKEFVLCYINPKQEYQSIR